MATLAEIRSQYPQYNGLSDADLATKMYEKFYSSKLSRAEFDQKIGYAPAPEIDTTTGAPWGVRTGVGAAPNAKDRLATIRKSYPDAKPYEGDNFVYTDPVTRKPTLYNPPGMDAGDFFSLAPEVGEFVGGVAGGATGVAAMPMTGGASAVTVPVMTGTGAVLGKKIAETSAQWLAGTVDSRTGLEHLTDDAVTGGVNTVAGPAAETVLRGARHLIGPKVQPLVQQAFERLQIKPMAGAVSGSQMVQGAEHGAFNSPGGTGVMQKSFEKTQEDVQRAAGEIADDIAGTTRPGKATDPRSTQDAGNVLKKGVTEAGKRFKENRQVLDDIVTQSVGATRPTQLTHTQQLLTDLQAELARAPNSRPELRRAIAEAERLITDAQAAGGRIPFDVLRKVRTRIGQELEQPDASGYLPGEDGYMRQLYGKLRDDVYGAAREADALPPGQKGPAERALDRHDRYVRMFRGDSGGRVPPIATFDKVLASGSDAKALQYAMEGSEQSTQRLWQLRRSLKPEEWDVVAATVFDTLGRAKPGAQGGSMLGEVGNDFSVATFLTNWQKLNAGQPGRTTRDVLFGGSQYGHVKGAIDDLVRVVDALKGSQKLANTSGTARSTAWHSLFGAVGGGVAGATSGNLLVGLGAGLGVGLASAVGTAGAAYGTARLLTSPKFVRWLTTSARTIGTQPNSWQSALTRLDLIAQHEPELRDEINQYRDQVANSFRQTVPAAP